MAAWYNAPENHKKLINSKKKIHAMKLTLKQVAKKSPVLFTLGLTLLAGSTAFAAIGIGGNIFGGGDSVNLQSGLVGHWKMDGNARDSTPHSNHGVVNGATLTADRHGQVGSAYEFSGSGEDITIASSDEIDLKTYTYSFWVRLDADHNGSYRRFLGRGDRHPGMWFRPENNRLHLRQRLADGTNAGADTVSELTLNEWTHVAFRSEWDGSQTTFTSFVNGTEEASAVYVSEPDSISTGLIIGNTQFGIDDVRVYDRAINDAEVSALYEAQYPPSEIQVSDLQKGLVGHWDMNGDAKDRTPWSNHGATNDVTLTDDRRGLTDNAYLFNGSTAHIDIPSEDNLKPDGEISISAWFYRNAQGSGWNPVVEGAGNLNNGTGYYFGFSSNSSVFRMTVGDGGYVNATSSLNTGQWYHAVGVFSVDGGFIKLYIDGVEVSSTAHSKTSISYESHPIAVGRLAYSLSTGHRFDGIVDDLRIYSRALDQPEIAQLYDSYRPSIQMSDLSKGLIGHWDMNGDAKDRTPWSNHGNLVNGPIPTTDRHGRSDSAYDFNGTDNNIDLSGEASPGRAKDLTISVWAKAPPSGGGWILGEGAFFRMSMTPGGSASWWVREENFGASNTATGGVVSADTWHNLSGTYNSQTGMQRLYLDGVEVASQSLGYAGLGADHDSFTIGRNYSTSTGYFDGQIGDVRLYNRALSAEEVTMLHDTYR